MTTSFPRRSAVAAALTLLVPGLAGCAARPYATLQTVGATVPGAHLVDMLVATTRAPSPVPGVVFSGERGPGLSVENIVVSIPPDAVRRPGAVIYPRRNPGDPAREFVALKIAPIEAKGAEDWYQRVAGPKRRVLIFVHGFNSTYEEAVFRFAQISHDTGVNAAPILFTWPSQGSIFGYLYDRESANYSRDSLERIIEDTAARPDVGEITVMAHSMGSWLTMEALRQTAIRRGRLPAKLTNVILASPDLDVDVFQEQLDEIGPERSRITIFTSKDDRALLVSRRLAGGVQRLGAVDLTKPEVQATFERRGIDVVDLTGVRAGDGLNHTKFAESADVVQSIGRRLIAGDRVSDSRLGLGETIGAAAIGTAQGVGSAISATVNLPAAAVDAGARERLARQVEETAASLGGSLQTATGR
ncbi:alpha/beta hydrolase [Aureimonas pseudogalii]|uniref:Esterase/lipase superfamily enzyme n=1 Tax=Aureimonas pseudogalii TaxID=1744844 RepID=A0A7W6H7A6_9HYPH|nr:alpha/beta hydrolase [Aureimonas pseudogalii]MBB3999827.1 esterase/lipase superfamily enzyme [Aureimonas pseudogalii]